MVVKVGNLPSDITGERRVLIDKLIPYIDEQISLQHQEPAHIIRLDCSPFEKFGSKNWLFEELVRLYQEDGGWKYATVTIHHSYNLYLSNSHPLRHRSWDWQASLDGDTPPKFVSGSRMAFSTGTHIWSVALIIGSVLILSLWMV